MEQVLQEPTILLHAKYVIPLIMLYYMLRKKNLKPKCGLFYKTKKYGIKGGYC